MLLFALSHVILLTALLSFFSLSSASDVGIDDCPVGVVILGNPGSGKSLIGNIILGNETFLHKYSPDSVTRTFDYGIGMINGVHTAIYNIPGLIEPDPDQQKQNKDAIDQAFERKQRQIVMFVFTPSGGRIVGSDLEAFRALETAFDLQRESLVIVVNNYDDKINKNYEKETTAYLLKLLKWDVTTHLNIVFIPTYSADEALRSKEGFVAQQKLFKAINTASPYHHTKKEDIKVNSDKIAKAEMEISDLIKQKQQLLTEFNEILKEKEEENTKNLKAIHDKYARQMEEMRKAANKGGLFGMLTRIFEVALPIILAA